MSFTKLIFLNFCLLFAIASHGQEGIIFSDITLGKALELSADQNKPVFLFATWKGCGLCEHLVSKEFSNNELGKYYNNKFINIRVDYDTDQFKKVTDKYGEIKDFPAVLYINTDGSLLTTKIGYVSYTEYLSIGKQIYGEEEIVNTKIPPPSINEFVSWSKLNDSELSQRMSEMEMKDKSTEECLKFTPNGEDEIFYTIERCSNNSMIIDYGVKVKKGSSTYQKFTTNVAEFFNELKPHYSEKKSLMGQEVNYYRFVKNGTHYLLYVLDWPPIYCPETSICGGKKIFLKWE